MKNVLFVISGPSGVGKGTLVKRLMKKDKTLSLSISCTTRSPRKDERDGKDYFFVTEAEFQKKIEENGFLEYDEHFENFYGTPSAFVDEKLQTSSVILEIDVVGALKVREACARSDRAAPVLIMICPPDLETLEARLKGRKSETEEERKLRLERVKYELAQSDKYDYTVVNGDLKKAERDLTEIINKERNKE